MTTKEHLAAAKANLAPALRAVRRSPESSALLNVVDAGDKLEDTVRSQSAPAPKASPLKRTPLKRTPLGKAK